MMLYSQEEICQYLRNHNLNAVARETGLNISQVQRFVKERVDARISTLTKLSEYVKDHRGSGVYNDR